MEKNELGGGPWTVLFNATGDISGNHQCHVVYQVSALALCTRALLDLLS